MGKALSDTYIDLQLDQVEGIDVHVCSAEPTTYLEAATTFQLATEAAIGGSYAKANGDSSGRKNTLTPSAGTTIDNTGTATHVAVTNGASPRVITIVTTCTSQALTAAGTVDIGAFDHEIGDVT